MQKIIKPIPINHELFLCEGEFIVSKTDLKGVITYCNKTLVRITQYKEEELLGSNHNIIRHPDMPKIVYKYMWDRIKQCQEVVAYVKNIAKDGSFYWVMAYVTPSLDSNNTLYEYHSMRIAPKKEALDIIKDLYQTLLDLESKGGMQKSSEYLESFLKQKNTNYDEFIISL